MAAKPPKPEERNPGATLEALAKEAIKIARTARANSKSLAGDNFYGNKLADLRADAAIAYGELTSQSAGDTTALAELIQSIFATSTTPQDRLDASREAAVALRTTWKKRATSDRVSGGSESFIPLTILTEANRGYLVSIGRQLNGCFAQGWYDACAVMMRRLLEISIIEAFEHKNIADRIRDAHGDYLHLSDLISAALKEKSFPLSRNAKKFLPQLRDVGHLSAHGRTYHARRDDLERIHMGCRVTIEEFLTLAGLL